jgi:NAD-dependent dihydropyrimidine dehydrogenase PreA subunit
MTYDTRSPDYMDEGKLTKELERVFDVCHGCRLCHDLCPSFGTLFTRIDEEDGDVKGLKPADWNQITDECYQCKLCFPKCPMMTDSKVTQADLLDLDAYDRVRDTTLARIIALKALRRIALGDRVSLAFECRDTVVFQVQEMLRVERIHDPKRIQDELDVYNEIMPSDGALSATLFIEITSQDRVEADLNSLLGLEEHLWIEIAGERIKAWFEPGHSREDRISAVHYVRFKLPPALRAGLQSGAPVVISTDHPNYQARVTLTPEQVRELAKDVA